jgi:hypothetical protein
MVKPVKKSAMPCNSPRSTPTHPKKSHVVKACEGGKEKVIRFGQQGKKVGTVSGTAGKPKAGEFNKTREEVARDHITRAEVHRDMEKIMERFDAGISRLETKIDELRKETKGRA